MSRFLDYFTDLTTGDEDSFLNQKGLEKYLCPDINRFVTAWYLVCSEAKQEVEPDHVRNL